MMVALWILLAVEVVARAVLEVREARLTQVKGGAFGVLRLIPLVNDIVPLPESRKEPLVGNFVKFHEEAHGVYHHSVLRNLFKVAVLMLAVGLLAMLMGRYGLPLWAAILWLHVVAVPGRVLFHFYCWNQEYECDKYALEATDKQVAKKALRELASCEIPHTILFSLIYREHPSAALRKKRLLGR